MPENFTSLFLMYFLLCALISQQFILAFVRRKSFIFSGKVLFRWNPGQNFHKRSQTTWHSYTSEIQMSYFSPFDYNVCLFEKHIKWDELVYKTEWQKQHWLSGQSLMIDAKPHGNIEYGEKKMSLGIINTIIMEL
jgi:hypothetical protein